MKNCLRGKYQVIECIREEIPGGQETVYYVKDITSSTDQIYLLKQFTLKYDYDCQFQAAKSLFIQEAQILQKLGSHAQIPQIFDYFEENEQFFLVQELIEGQNLKQELEEKKHLTESEAIALLKDTLEILQFVHQNHYIHRDLKPSNFIRNKYDQKIYLIDFAIIKEKIQPKNLDSQGNFTRTVSIGTPSYIPDEQKLGKLEFCSDIYALGMVAIQALSGINPEDLSYDIDGNPLWHNHLLTSNYSPKFLSLINLMVCGNYRERYQSAAEVLKDLDNLNALEKTEKTYVLDSDSRPIEQEINNRLLRWLMLGLGGTIVGITSIFIIVNTIANILNTKSYKSYENLTYGIKVERPKNWSIQEEGDLINSGIIFISPEENSTDNFREQVKLSIEELSIPLSLDEYTEQAVQKIASLNSIIEPPKNISIANREGRRVIYQDTDKIKRLKAWTIKNQKAYIITYTSEADKFQKFAEQVEKIISSLEIK